MKTEDTEDLQPCYVCKAPTDCGCETCDRPICERHTTYVYVMEYGGKVGICKSCKLQKEEEAHA